MCNVTLGTWSRCRGEEGAFSTLSPSSSVSLLPIITSLSCLCSPSQARRRQESQTVSWGTSGTPAALSVASCCSQGHSGTSQTHCELGQTGMSSLVGEKQPWAEIARRKKLPCPVEFFFIPWKPQRPAVRDSGLEAAPGQRRGGAVLMDDVTPFPNASTTGDSAQSTTAGRGGCSGMVPTCEEHCSQHPMGH